MGLYPAHTNGPDISHSDAGELKLPALSPERKDTLESILTRIDAFAEYLRSAQNIFIQAETHMPGSDEEKKTIHDGKQQVNNALRALNSLQHLIEVKPDQVTHIATHVRKASTQLNRISNVIDRVLSTKTANNHTRVLRALAQACPRTSSELETSLGVPVRRTLTEQDDLGETSQAALIS
jgi:predicted  nucleic acid-binding Zn-ribbon protein